MVLCAASVPTTADADWFVAPFLGLKLDGKTNLVDLDQAAGESKMTLGGSAGFITDSLLGLEFDVGYSPGFFDSAGRGGLVARSNVTTVTGNVIFATPVSITRESLRPFVAAGVGLLHVGMSDLLGVFPIHRNLFGLDVGAGAIGAISRRTSLRFELRRFQNLTTDEAPGVSFGPSRLSFWRADVGLAFRY